MITLLSSYADKIILFARHRKLPRALFLIKMVLWQNMEKSSENTLKVLPQFDPNCYFEKLGKDTDLWAIRNVKRFKTENPHFLFREMRALYHIAGGVHSLPPPPPPEEEPPPEEPPPSSVLLRTGIRVVRAVAVEM